MKLISFFKRHIGEFAKNGGFSFPCLCCLWPTLVVDGVPLRDLNEVHIDNGKSKKAQRIIIGQVGPLDYLIPTNEGQESTWLVAEESSISAKHGRSMHFFAPPAVFSINCLSFAFLQAALSPCRWTWRSPTPQSATPCR